MDELNRLSTELLQHLSIGLVVWQLDRPEDDLSLRLIFANHAASRFTGIDFSTLIGRPLVEVLPSVSPERMHIYADVCRRREFIDLGTVLYGDAHIQQSVFSVKAVPVLDQAVAVVFENLSTLKIEETKARTLSRFLDSIIDELPAMVFLKDARHLRFERFNRAGEELLGVPRSQLIGKNDHDLFPKEQADFFVANDREVLEQKQVKDIPEEPIETPHGTRWLHTRKIPVLDDLGEPRHLLGVSIDITERKRVQEALRTSHGMLERSVVEQSVELERQIGERLRAEEALVRMEEQLRQSQRLEAIGRLAGGIAHDFNNILSVVLGYCDSMLQQLRESDPLREEVGEIHRAGRKAADLTRQLLAFSRQQVLQPVIIDLNKVLGDLERMLPRLLGEDITLTVTTVPGPASIKADPSQIEQVIVNLVVNARDAMPTGGRLTIETSRVELDQEFVDTHLGSRVGSHIMLAVSDTGEGMDRKTLDHMFEPFFTTKALGKGTGLGLSTVFGVVKQSDGSLFAYSEPNHGTTFKLYFPETSEAPSVPAEGPPPSELRGSETILLVEDDDQLRTLASAILKRRGYQVVACAGADEALTAADDHAKFDLLLTDVVMPEMSGRVLAEILTARLPTLRVLFMSGYTDDAIVRHGVLESSMAFLQKPFTSEVLARRVREVLESPLRSTARAS